MSNEVTVWGDSGNTGVFTTRYSQGSSGGIYPPGQIPGTGNAGDNDVGGSSQPGGIGTGDGGFNTPSDNTINQPVITFPNDSDNQGISEYETATSSAFSASGGRAHVASRWMIVYAGPTSEDPIVNAPTVIYDSGATGADLTALALTAALLEHEAWYYIRVRYKASITNTWSQWSNDQLFSTAACVSIQPLMWWDFSQPAGYTLVGTKISAVADLAPSGTRNGSQATDANRPVIDTTTLAHPSANFAGNIFMPLTAPLNFPSLSSTYSVFFVLRLDPAITTNTGIGFSQGTSASAAISIKRDAAALPAINFMLATGGQFASSTGSTGLHLFEISCPGGSVAGTTLRQDGVLLSKSTSGSVFGVSALNRIGELAGVLGGGHLGELRVYENLSAGDTTLVRGELLGKWGI